MAGGPQDASGAESSEAKEEAAAGEDPEVFDVEGQDWQDWEEEEDWGGFATSLGGGFWEGDSFRLEQFPAEPSSWTEGDVEVAQTMGTLDLVYYIPEEEAYLTHEDLTVEISGFRTKVTLPSGSSGKPVELGPLTGTLLHAVRPKFSVWRLLEENGQKCLHLHLAKLEHRSWKNLWAIGWNALGQGKKHRFAWQANKVQGPDPYEHQEFYKVPHETPPPRVQTEYRLDAVGLCLGMDDVEEFGDHAVVRVHFNRGELDRLEAVMPLEDVLTAEVQERHLRVFLRVTGEDGQEQLNIFDGELQGRCVPELSAWQLVRAAKGNPKGKKGEAFNPALEFALAKHPEEQKERWGQLFSHRVHAAELVTEKTASNGKDKDYRRCEAQLRARMEALLGPDAGYALPAPVLEPPEPTPSAPSAEVVVEKAKEELEELREYLIDNSELQAPTKGLGYRLSRHLHDKDGSELAEWGTTVWGADAGDGWVKIGRRYLPTKLSGKDVLTSNIIGLPRHSETLSPFYA